jgi:hypothetical protein
MLPTAGTSAWALWAGRLQSVYLTRPPTEKQKPQLILARRGQGKFRKRVLRIEHACHITGVNRPEHLIASHKLTDPHR